MRFFTLWFVLIMFLAMMGIGGALYHEDNTRDIYNFTNSALVWNYSNKVNQSVVNSSWNVSRINIERLLTIIHKGVDTMGFITFEITKWGIEIGFRNPEWNYIFIAKLVFYFAWFLMIVQFLPLIGLLVYWAYKKIKKRKEMEDG